LAPKKPGQRKFPLRKRDVRLPGKRLPQTAKLTPPMMAMLKKRISRSGAKMRI